MALHTLNFWEIAIDATQIGLCGLILLFLIRNRMKLQRLNLNAPSGEESKKVNTEFVVEAVRQQTELAFNHILETIDKERLTLYSYFELRESKLATIYSEIKSLSDQGLSLADIAEKLNVPRGEVDLVLKLRRLRIESAKVKDNPQE